MTFDPGSILKRKTLFREAVEDLLRSYSPLSQPVLRQVIEGFSREVHREAGLPFESKEPFTPEQNKLLEDAQNRLVNKPIGGYYENLRLSMGVAAKREFMKNPGSFMKFDTSEIPSLTSELLRQNPQADQMLSDARHFIVNEQTQKALKNAAWENEKVFDSAKLYFGDYQALKKLGQRGATWRSALETITGAYLRPMAKLGEQLSRSEPLDVINAGMTGIVENVGKYRPALYGKSNAGDMFLVEKSLHAIWGFEHKSKRTIDLGYEARNPIRAVKSLMDEYEDMSGGSRIELLAKMGYAPSDLDDPNVARFVLDQKAQILNYSHEGSGLFPSGEEGIIYTSNPNEVLGKRISQAIGRGALPVSLYSRSQSVFNEQGELNPATFYVYGSIKFKEGRPLPVNAFPGSHPSQQNKKVYSASGYYLKGYQNLESMHKLGLTRETMGYMPYQWQENEKARENPLIKKGVLKQVKLTGEDINRLLTLDPSTLSGEQREIFNRYIKEIKAVGSSLAAVSLPPDDLSIDEDFRNMSDADLFPSFMYGRPVHREIGDTSGLEFRRDYLVPRGGTMVDTGHGPRFLADSGEMRDNPAQWLDTSSGEVIYNSQYNRVASQWREAGSRGSWRSLGDDDPSTVYSGGTTPPKEITPVSDFQTVMDELESAKTRYHKAKSYVNHNFSKIAKQSQKDPAWGDFFWSKYRAIKNRYTLLSRRMAGLSDYPASRELIQEFNQLEDPKDPNYDSLIDDPEDPHWGGQTEIDFWNLSYEHKELQGRITAQTKFLDDVRAGKVAGDEDVAFNYLLGLQKEQKAIEKQLLKSETGRLAYGSPEETPDPELSGKFIEDDINRSLKMLQGYPDKNKLVPGVVGEVRLTDEQLQALAQEDQYFYENFVLPYQKGKDIIHSDAFKNYSQPMQKKMGERYAMLRGRVSVWTKQNRTQKIMGLVEEPFEYQGADKPLVHAASKMASTGRVGFIGDKKYYAIKDVVDKAGPRERFMFADDTNEGQSPPLHQEAKATPSSVLGPGMPPPRRAKGGLPMSEMGFEGAGMRRQTMPSFDGEGMPLMSTVRFYNQRPGPRNTPPQKTPPPPPEDDMGFLDYYRDNPTPKSVEMAKPPRALDPDNPAKVYENVPMGSQAFILNQAKNSPHNLLIYGMAGTGKTQTLAEMVKLDLRRGIDPSEMVFLTGTTVAHEVFEERMQTLDVNNVGAMSFHQFGFQVLREHAGQFGIPADFSGRNVMSAASHIATTYDIVENLGFAPERFKGGIRAEENYNYEFTDVAYKYSTALESFRSMLMSPDQFGTAEYEAWVKRQQVDPRHFEQVYYAMEDTKRQNQLYSLSDLVAEPVDIVRSFPKKIQYSVARQLYGSISGIYLDEVSQIGTAARTMVEQFIGANPQAKISMVGDAIQSLLWKFLGGGPQNAERLAAQTSAQKLLLDANYRLPAGAVDLVSRLFHLPKEMRPKIVDREGRTIRREGTPDARIAGFLRDTHIALNPTDKFKMLTDKLKGWHEAGGEYGSMMVIAPTKKELDAAYQYLTEQGIPAAIKPSEEYYKDDLGSGRMTPSQVAAKVEMDKANMPTNAVVLGTTHALTGDEAEHVSVLMSKSDLERLGNSYYDRATVISSAVTRAMRGGQFAMISSWTNTDENYEGIGGSGGAPSLLQGLGSFTNTPAAQELQNMRATRRPSRRMVEMQPQNVTVQDVYRRIENTPLSDVGNRALENGARDVMKSLVDRAIKELDGDKVTPKDLAFSKKLREKIDQFVLDYIDQSLDGVTTEEAQQSAPLRTSLNKLRKSITGLTYERTGGAPAGHVPQSPDYYEYHPYGGGPGAPPPTDRTRGAGMPSPRNRRWSGYGDSWNDGQIAQDGGFEGPLFKNPFYRFSRGLWALTMGARVAGQGFAGEFTAAKRYTDYLGTYAPIAGMVGEFEHSPYSEHFRRMEAERMSARGAYEQWGAFTTIPHALTKDGFEGLPRLMSAGKTSFSILAGSAQAAFGLSLMPGGATIGAGLMTAGAIASVGIMGGAIAMEVYNQKHPTLDRLSYSHYANETLKGFYVNRAIMQEYKDTGAFYSGYLGSLGRSGYPSAGDLYYETWESADINRDEMRDWYFENEVKDQHPDIYWQVQGTQSPLAEQVEQIATDLYNQLGIPFEQTAQFARTALSETLGTRPEKSMPFKAFSQWANSLGLTGNEAWSRRSQLAQNLGYMVGSWHYSHFMWQGPRGETPEEEALMHTMGARYGQYASQITGYFTTPNLANQLVSRYAVTTQPQASAMSAVMAPAAQYGANEQQLGTLAGLSTYESPMAAKAIAGIGGMWANAGLNPYEVESALLGQGLTMPELNLFGNIAGGDLRALSYASWTGAFGGELSGWENRFFDQLGFPIFQKSGENFINWATAHGIGANAATAWAPAGNYLQGANWFQNFLGHSNMSPGYYEAWAQGGSEGAGTYIQGQLAGIAGAQAALAMQQLNAQRAHLWGSGSWNAPAQGSMWWYEDQMRALQHSSTMASFASTERTMRTQYEYTGKMQDISYERMTASQDYNRWNMGFNQLISQLQRGWTRQDWGYQDQMRGLSFEWGLEDINEAIRGSTGRQRRNLIRQRDRMVTQNNLEEEQIDKTRQRQEEMWALEDERYQKVFEHQEHMIELDTRTFELNKEHRETMFQYEMEDFQRKKQEYEEQRALQEEIIQKQREHQAEMMEYQEKSIQLQSASATLQWQLAQDQKKVQDAYLEHLKEAELANEYEPSQGNIGKLTELVEHFGNLNSSNITTVTEMIRSMQGHLPGADAIVNVVQAFNRVDVNRLWQLYNFLMQLP